MSTASGSSPASSPASSEDSFMQHMRKCDEKVGSDFDPQSDVESEDNFAPSSEEEESEEEDNGDRKISVEERRAALKAEKKDLESESEGEDYEGVNQRRRGSIIREFIDSDDEGYSSVVTKKSKRNADEAANKAFVRSILADSESGDMLSIEAEQHHTFSRDGDELDELEATAAEKKGTAKKYKNGTKEHSEHCRDQALKRRDAGTDGLSNFLEAKAAKKGGTLRQLLVRLLHKGEFYGENGCWEQMDVDELRLVIDFLVDGSNGVRIATDMVEEAELLLKVPIEKKKIKNKAGEVVKVKENPGSNLIQWLVKEEFLSGDYKLTKCKSGAYRRNSKEEWFIFRGPENGTVYKRREDSI